MRNIVVICLDSVRKDYFDEYAPRLAERADITVDQCRAASGWSVPSHASMLTGELPSAHGVHTHNLNFGGIADKSIAAEIDAYQSLCVSANGFTTEEFGFDVLFDELVAVSPGRRFPKGIDVGGKSVRTILDESLESSVTLRSLANGVYNKLYWLVDMLSLPTPFDQGASLVRKHSRQRFDDTVDPIFLFTNFMEGHHPHKPSLRYDSKTHSVPWSWSSTDFDHFEANVQGREYLEEHQNDVENFRQLYAASIDYLDRQVDTFIEEIQERSSRETTFVITADHGENLGYEDDEYLMCHNSSLSEGLLHVPLLIVNPPSDWTMDVDECFSHLELPRLVTALVNETRFRPTNRPVTAELIGGGAKPAGEAAYWDRMIRCGYEGQNKYVWDSLGDTALFTLDSSRPCAQTLYETDVTIPPAILDSFPEDIETYKSRAKSTTGEELDDDVDVGTQQRLKDLGYL